MKKEKAELSFEISKADRKIMTKIIERIKVANPLMDDVMALEMDLVACHANGCPLNLKKLLEAPDFDFIHDVNGIRRHINRTTGEIENCFLPRTALKKGVRR